MTIRLLRRRPVPVEDPYRRALCVAEEQIRLRRDREQAAKDPADVAASGRASECLEATS